MSLLFNMLSRLVITFILGYFELVIRLHSLTFSPHHTTQAQIHRTLKYYPPWQADWDQMGNEETWESFLNLNLTSTSPCLLGLRFWSQSLRLLLPKMKIKPTLGFPGGSDGKESACNVGGLDSIPGLGRSPGGGRGSPLQCACLENLMAVPEVAESAATEWLSLPCRLGAWIKKKENT